MTGRISAPLCLLLAVLLVPSPLAKTSEPALRAEIMLVLSKQQTAWNQGDIPGFMAGYWNSPELTFAGSSGVSRGWQAVSDRYQRSYPDKARMGQLQFSDLEVRSLGDSSALVLGKWHLTRAPDDIGGVFTLILARLPDGWKIIHDHTSQVVPKNP